MMTAIMIDSNVPLDLMTVDTRWLSWSAAAVERAADRFRLVINPIIYALSATRGNKAITASGLFHRRPRGGCRVSAADPRCGALSQLLSQAAINRP
jgi:hypothetical protein